jgi:polyferredoxin
VGIDIKDGLSSKCIACAECIDACWLKSSKRDLPPFPNYKGKIVRPKTFWLGGITALSAIVMVLLIAMRPPLEFVLSRVQEPLPSGLNRYAFTIYNNSSHPLELELTAPKGVTLIGERTVSVKPFGVVRNKVLLRSEGKRDRISLTLKGDGISVSREAGFL